MGGDRHAAGVPAYGTGGDRYGLRVGGCSLCTASGHGRTVFQNGFEEAFHRRDFGIQRFFPKTDLVGRELFRTASESPALQFGDGAFQAGDGFIAQGNGRLLLAMIRVRSASCSSCCCSRLSTRSRRASGLVGRGVCGAEIIRK
jgi:hypothetical protein